MQREGTGVQAAATAKAKLRLAIWLQISAFLVLVVFVYLEHQNVAWGKPIPRQWLSAAVSISVAEPLVRILQVGFWFTILGLLVGFAGAYRFIDTMTRNGKAETVVRKANWMIVAVVGLDVVGLGMLMVISKGAPDFLPLFLTVAAVAVVFTAPCSTQLPLCASCRWAREVGGGFWLKGVWRFVGWLLRPLWFVRPSGWCFYVLAMALGTYWAAGVYELAIARWLGMSTWLVQGEYVSFLPRTVLACGVGGALQILFAQYARETTREQQKPATGTVVRQV
jgi:hypothetical protein